MLADSLSIRRTDKIVYQVGDPLLLISVPHTGTRYADQVLSGFGCSVQVHHCNHSPLLKEPLIKADAVVPLRDPYKCFLSWWKDEIDADTENVSSLGCLALWNALDYVLYMRRANGAKTIIWRIDQESEEDLAERLGVPYVLVEANRFSSYLTDRYVQPVRSEFPDDLASIAARWGY